MKMKKWAFLGTLCLIWVEVSPGWTGKPLQDEDSIQVLTWEHERPLWKNGKSYVLNHPSLKAQISEIGVVDHWDYFINQEGAFFHSTENRINWVLAFEVLAKDSNSEEANGPVITYQKKMKTPAVALGWHLYRTVDPMTAALSFRLELEIEKAPVNPGQEQGILGALFLPAKKEAFTATFDANGQCIKVEIGAGAGVPGSKRKIRVDKH